ncbi:MAG: DNA primase [Actinomycetota bacterium]|nr:DNA primase [Actinomycetota bacterium]
MTRYTDDSRDRVRDAVDIVSLVSAKTELRRAGVDSYFGICPFHEERTASFHVSPEKKLYHCFGCQASGDPFDFVMQTEGLEFTGALEALAGRFGVTLEAEGEDPRAAERRQRRERLQSLLGRTAGYYARYLWEAREAGPARDYLLGRGLDEQTLRRFRVGYAPSAWDRILTASRRSGYSDEELLAVGLAQRSRSRPGQLYDRFRERIMFPSADSRGRVRGFGARAMRDNQRPKYLNTSDSDLYHKRSQLFGIDLARAEAARAGRMVLVEGYTDVIALHQAGLVNAVGIMGTSLTEEQVSELERVVPVLELCLDADSAGQEAMLRAARLAAGRKLELRVVPLPHEKDPADLIQSEGAAALRALVEASVPFVVFRVGRILERADTGSAEGRDRAVAELKPVIAGLSPSVLREEVIRRVAGRLELSEGMVESVVAGRADPGTMRPGGGEATQRSTIGHGIRGERTFLALCIALPDEGAVELADADLDELLTSEQMRRAARHLAGRTEAPLEGLPADDEELARTVADLVARSGRAGVVRPDRLRHARLVLERARLDRAIRRARAQNGEEIPDLARRREEILEDIRGVVASLERAL